MKMLRKKLYRDIRFNKSQFITIFLMVLLGVFVFAGVHAYMDGMEKSGDRFYKENNFQDLWLIGENFSKDDLEKVKSTKNVKDAERLLTVMTSLKDFDDVTLEANFIETNNISKMYIVEGEEFDKEKSGVWIDSYLAKNLNLKVGDEITFSYQKYDITEKILGLVNTPDHIYSVKNSNEIFPTHKDFGFVYLSINEFPKDYIYDKAIEEIVKQNPMIDSNSIDTNLIGNLIEDFYIGDYYVFNYIIVDIDDEEKTEETKKELTKNISSALAVTDREASMSYSRYNMEIEQGNTYSSVFTSLFLFIAILSVVTTMNRFVRKERTNIGTLKALGVKKIKIIGHYVSYGFYISLVASILGVILGNFTLGKYFITMEMVYYEVPNYHTVILPVVYIMAVCVVAIITLVTFLSCRKVLKEPAAEALRVEMPKVKKSRFKFSNKGMFKNAKLSTRWNLRDMTRNKGRTIMAIIGIVGCTMLIVCAFGLLDTMNSYLDWEFDGICNFEYRLSLEDEYTDERFEELTGEYSNSTSQTIGIEIKNNDKKETNTLTINDSAGKLRYTNDKKEYIELEENGVYITEKLSETLNLKIGDEISWRVFGDTEWIKSKIVGLNRDPQTQQLNMTRKFYEDLGYTYRADTIYTDKDLSNLKEIEGVNTFQSAENLKNGMQSMLGPLKSMVVLLIAASVILGIVIIYNLGILSFSEKQYQYATLKVLGFKDKQIKKIFVKQSTWITVASIIVGLPFGYYMTDYIFKSALGDGFDLSAEIKIISYAISIIGIFAISFIVNKVLAKKIETIDMVSCLKGNE